MYVYKVLHHCIYKRMHWLKGLVTKEDATHAMLVEMS